MESKKLQAAMEFLMTYGWAIFVVLAVIAAMAYFGVLSPDKTISCDKVLENKIFSQYERCNIITEIKLRQELDSKASNLCDNLRKDNEIYPEYQEKINFMEANLVRGFIYIPESINLINNKPRIVNTGVEDNQFKWTGDLSGIESVFCIIPSETCYAVENITVCITNQDRMEFDYNRWSEWINN